MQDDDQERDRNKNHDKINLLSRKQLCLGTGSQYHEKEKESAKADQRYRAEQNQYLPEMLSFSKSSQYMTYDKTSHRQNEES